MGSGVKERISGLQFMLLMLWLVAGTGIITLPTAINKFAPYQDGWIVALLFIFGPLTIVVLYWLYIRVFPAIDVGEACIRALGSWLGRLAVLWIALWACISTSTVNREFSIFVELNYLPHTPIYVITFLLSAACSFAIFKGIEVIGRVTEIVSLLCLAALFGLMAMSLKEAHLEYLRPVLSQGWRPVFQGLVYPYAFSLELLISLFMISAFKGPSRGSRYLLYTGIILTVAGLVLELVSIVVMGPLGSSLAYPILGVVQSIVYGEFIQRLDPIYVLIVISTVYIKLAVFLFAAVRSLKSLAGVNRYQSLTWGTGLLTWAGSVFLFHSSADVSRFVLESFPTYTFSVVLLILVVLIVGWMRVRRT